MGKIKCLNMYCGAGGNRQKWDNDLVEVTAIENVPEIAKIYQDFFPNDKVIVADAHQYLLEHYKEFDFIWSSPPCPTHSRIRQMSAVARGQNEAVFPDMELYQEIIFLMYNFKGKWVVENVVSYYEPLIKPYKFREHYYWANFVIDGKKDANRKHNAGNKELSKLKGFDLSNYKGINKTKILRNCVEPEAGRIIFDMAYKTKQEVLDFV